MAACGPPCSICYETYGESNNISSTKCGHIFHTSCLQQWIKQSNTCPTCNSIYPEPHRIYLDIGAINEAIVPNSPQETDGHTVVLKGVKPNQVTTPLYSFIKKLIILMQVPITEKDIKDISKRGRKGFLLIHVTLKTRYHMNLFLKKKYKLKKNPETSEIRIYELLKKETEALFQYTQCKLKNADYKHVYAENKRVFVKKHQYSHPINILTRDQVDALCLQHTNHCKKASTSIVQRNNKKASTSIAFTVVMKYLSKIIRYLCLKFHKCFQIRFPHYLEEM